MKIPKPPVDTYEKLLSFISNQLRKAKLANYQPVMIKTLLVNGARTRQEIAGELRKQNDPSKDVGYYMTVPVYAVLTEHGIVSPQGTRNPTFSLNFKTYSQQEFDELVKQLDLWIARSNTFLETGFLPLKEAKEKARKLAIEHNLKTAKDWEEFVKSGKKPDDMPSNPSQFYKKGKILVKNRCDVLKYNKAIRDKIPKIIENSGYSSKIKKLSNKKFLKEMEKKLLEETKEYLRDKESHELADILEVIYRIAELKGISVKELEKIRIKKKEDRGGFKKNIFLIETRKSS